MTRISGIMVLSIVLIHIKLRMMTEEERGFHLDEQVRTGKK